MITTYKARKVTVENKAFFPFKDALIFDIETTTIEGKEISAENCHHKIWGVYSYNSGKLKFGMNNRLEFQKLIDSHRIIIGHNIKGFDIPILERDLNINFRGKTIIDTLEVLRKPPSRSEKEAFKRKGKKPFTGKGRAAIIGEARQIGMKDDRFPNLKMETIAKHGHKLFKDHPIYSQYFKEYKDESFDYAVLNKPSWTDEEDAYVKEYLRQDIIVTKNIFEFLEKYFESFIHYLPIKDILNLDYMHSPTGSYAYKCICKELGLEERYGEPGGTFPGAYVYLPYQEKFTPVDGDGYCIDFNSQHPSHQRMGNLYTPIKKCKHKVKGECPNPWSGDGKIFDLLGTYCGCEQGAIEKLLTTWYIDRLAYKKVNDPREYTIKILINATYGISASSIFESIYHTTTGPDTTRMSSQSIKFMQDYMEKGGYTVTYGDTDSLYIIDPFKDKARMQKYMAKGIAQIKAILPFVDEHYDMGIDAEFTHIFFFIDEESKDKHYKKKNYIYITKDNKVKINGLPLLKSNAPLLAKNIYNKYLEKEILRTKNIKFDKDYLRQLIQFEVGKDKNVLSATISVKPSDSYANEGQMQAQISRKYFEGKGGQFKGVKHKRKGYGIGKGKFYCSIKEAKSLGFHEYDLDTVWRVLDPFVKKDKQCKLGEF